MFFGKRKGCSGWNSFVAFVLDALWARLQT
jgi:hypothetical protein